MNIIGIIDEDLINYKKISMVIEMPYCNWKCGRQVCHNAGLASAELIQMDNEDILKRYLDDPLSEAIIFQGLEPFDSFGEVLSFIKLARQYTNDDIVIYTGYNEDEIPKDWIDELKKLSNIIIKWGRYVAYQPPHFDSILEVYLASDNQYAQKIS